MNDYRLDTLKKKDFDNDLEYNIFRHGRVIEVEQMLAIACIEAHLLSKVRYDRIMEAHKSNVTKGLLEVRREIADNINYGKKYSITLRKTNFNPIHCNIVKGASRLTIVLDKIVYKMIYTLRGFGDQNKTECDAFREALNVYPDSKQYIAGVYREFNAYYALIAVKADSVGVFDGLKAVCEHTGHDYNQVERILNKIGVNRDLHQHNIGVYQGRPCVIDYGL